MQVIKLGGRTQANPDLASALAVAFRRRPGSICIVHGGGDEVSSLQVRLGLAPKMQGGRRITTEADLEVVRMVLSGSANKRLVSMLSAAGVAAVGISGEDGGLLEAAILDRETYGYVGTPSRVDTRALRTLLAGGFLPVISPVARESSAPFGALNVNGDDAAAAIAGALEARELLFVSDVPGVRGDNGDTLNDLDLDSARFLVQSGVAGAGMAAKLEAAIAAIDRGVGCVRIGDIASISDPVRGTRVSQFAGLTL